MTDFEREVIERLKGIEGKLDMYSQMTDKLTLSHFGNGKKVGVWEELRTLKSRWSIVIGGIALIVSAAVSWIVRSL